MRSSSPLPVNRTLTTAALSAFGIGGRQIPTTASAGNAGVGNGPTSRRPMLRTSARSS